MPISRGSHISAVIEEVKFVKPNSILDVGIGFGHMGVLFRAYTDIRLSEIEHSRYSVWQTVIDGIEIHKAYKSPAWEMYSNVILGNAMTAIESLRRYDMVYCGDMIEHLSKHDGHVFIKKLLEHGNVVYIATPSPAPVQPEILDNPHEKHISSWDPDDFSVYKHQIVGSYDGILLVKLIS